MIKRREVSRWMGLLILSASALGQKQDQDYTIRTTSRLVLLDVSVKDSASGFVSGLTKDNFKIYEEGKPQQISQFGNKANRKRTRLNSSHLVISYPASCL